MTDATGAAIARESLIDEDNKWRLANVTTPEDRTIVLQQIGCDAGARVMLDMLMQLGAVDLAKLAESKFTQNSIWAYAGSRAWGLLENERLRELMVSP